MSWFLFMDESGHDHKHTPYEVRGGIAFHASHLWEFVQDMKFAERQCFGRRRNTEIKGSTLLKQERLDQSQRFDKFSDEERQFLCREFLSNNGGNAKEHTAYAQACILLVDRIFDLSVKHGGKIFASVIPRGIKKPMGFQREEYLRKDHVFLLERYFYFLESKKDHGVLVMDETEKKMDKNFVAQIEKYFIKTYIGKQRSQWIVPTPFFVSSDMAYPVQAADVFIYCVNWGFRTHKMDKPPRPFLHERYGGRLNNLQFKGDGYRDELVFPTSGIIYVPDPYTSRGGD